MSTDKKIRHIGNVLQATPELVHGRSVNSSVDGEYGTDGRRSAIRFDSTRGSVLLEIGLNPDHMRHSQLLKCNDRTINRSVSNRNNTNVVIAVFNDEVFDAANGGPTTVMVDRLLQQLNRMASYTRTKVLIHHEVPTQAQYRAVGQAIQSLL